MTTTISTQRAEALIRLCQDEVEQAVTEGNPPFGCVITDSQGKVLYKTHNTQNTDNDPTAHAEIKALRELGKRLGSTYLDGCILFANAESCAMCLFASTKAHVREFYFGAEPEHRVDAWLSVHDIAKHCDPPLIIHDHILQQACTEQLARARQTVPSRSANKPATEINT